MEHKNTATIKEVQWLDVKKELERVKPDLSHLIDNLTSKPKLYIAEYPFGAKIIEEGIFFIPTSDGVLAPINDTRILPKIQNDLGYNYKTIPLGIILHNSAELFIRAENRNIPFSFMKEGKIFGLWGTLNPTHSFVTNHIWHIMAGARYIFILPKLTEVSAYRKLARARNIKQPLPRDLADQWAVLKQMSAHPEFSSQWRVRLLLFPKNWLKKHYEDEWTKFRLYLHEEAWNGTEYWRNKVAYDLLWDSFVRELNRQYISVPPRVIDIVNHLIMIGLGVVPGFAPATDEEEAPVKGFWEDLMNIYGLKNFAPAIMVPRHFSQNQKEPVYWSFQLPTYLESSPKARAPSSIIAEMRETKQLLDSFYKSVLEGKIKDIGNTPLYNLVQEVQYDFFHSEVDLEGNIKPSQDMPKEDPRLIDTPQNNKKTKFSDVSPFVRGCVRISKKKK